MEFHRPKNLGRHPFPRVFPGLVSLGFVSFPRCGWGAGPTPDAGKQHPEMDLSYSETVARIKSIRAEIRVLRGKMPYLSQHDKLRATELAAEVIELRSTPTARSGRAVTRSPAASAMAATRWKVRAAASTRTAAAATTTTTPSASRTALRIIVTAVTAIHGT